MDKNVDLEKWDLPLIELYRLGISFYKENTGKALHLSYEDNLKLVSLRQQATNGPFPKETAPELGVLDVIGRDRRMHWQILGDMTQEQAMEGYIDLLHSLCNAFRPYVEAVKKHRDETLKDDLRRMEQEKQEREKKEREQQEQLEEGYKEEIQRRQLQDALNRQTYQQFKSYAEKQFPGNPEQQAVLIHQLQQEHYHQYMQQLHMQNQNLATISQNNNGEVDESRATATNGSPANINSQNMTDGTAQEQPQNDMEQLNNEDDDYIIIRPAKIWTRPDIEEFKTEVSAGDGDGVITIGHGDTVTVRVPTNANGKCLFWEFATDSYDIGFGIYFEWSKPVTSEVTVHVSDSDEDDDFTDEEFLSTTEDLECGSTTNERNALSSNISTVKPPISIIVPIYRRECFNEVYVGSHPYPGEGVYLLKFDNSYSIWRSKTLYYRVYYER